MDSKKQETIFKLKQVLDLLAAQKKEDELTDNDWKIFSFADSYFGEDYRFSGSYSNFLKNLPPSAVGDVIKELEKEEEKEEEEKEEEGNSIPPELESLVAEYRQNQALLEDDEIKSSGQKTVAEQVKIAIAHSKIKSLALANRERRLSQGETFQDADDVIVQLGSPKSSSATAAYTSSFKAVKLVAFTYSGFSKLPPELQNQIISSAVELNTIGVTDIDTAIQAATIQIDTTTLDDKTKSSLATIPGGFVSVVYREITSSSDTTARYEAQITTNEDKILELQKQGKHSEAQALIEENQHLSAYIENQSTRLNNLIAKQTDSFKDFEKSRQTRLSKDPDLVDIIENANKNITSIYDNLESHGVTPHLYSSLDDAQLLEEAIRHDLPGTLRPSSGYDAEYAAALVNDESTRSADLDPQAILLYGKELTPKLLAKAREFAQSNPDSALGKLFKTRKDIFDAAGSQIRKISESPLGKQISKNVTGIGKVFKQITGFFSKISDRIPGGFGNLIRIASDPIGAFRSWAGRKIGEYVIKKIASSAAGKAAEAALKKLASKVITEGMKKAIASIATKIGVEIALASTGVGIIVDVVLIVLDILKSVVQKAAVAIYGEEIKARDLLAAPAAVLSAVVTFFVAVGTATVAAFSSATVIVLVGTIIGLFVYITSIATAPLLSTLVQLEGTRHRTGPAVIGCAGWPTDGQYTLGQGPLGTCTHTRGVQGIDIEAPENSSMIAVAPGTVTFAGNLGNVYGNFVIVSSDTAAGHTDIWYAHLNEIGVSDGNSVSAGSEIGLVGGTGGWSPHIHIEYRGIEYNSCPAGDIPVPEGCCNYGGEQCTYNGAPIISNQTTP